MLILYFTLLFYTIPYYNYIILYYQIPYYTILNYNLLHCYVVFWAPIRALHAITWSSLWKRLVHLGVVQRPIPISRHSLHDVGIGYPETLFVYCTTSNRCVPRAGSKFVHLTQARTRSTGVRKRPASTSRTTRPMSTC